MSMPKPTLKANFETGEGSIGNLNKFRELDPLLRADLLRDWMHDIGLEYADALSEAFVSFKKTKTKTITKLMEIK